MPQSYYGSINLTKLLGLAKLQHSSCNKHANGNIYVNVDIYIKDQPDQFGHDASVSIVPSKAAKESGEQRAYIGNLKKSKSQPITGDDLDLPDIPHNAPFTDGNSHANLKDEDQPF